MRENNPWVDEIVRRYVADKSDFADVEEDFDCLEAWNGDGAKLGVVAESTLSLLGDWLRLGKID